MSIVQVRNRTGTGHEALLCSSRLRDAKKRNSAPAIRLFESSLQFVSSEESLSRSRSSSFPSVCSMLLSKRLSVSFSYSCLKSSESASFRVGVKLLLMRLAAETTLLAFVSSYGLLPPTAKLNFLSTRWHAEISGRAWRLSESGGTEGTLPRLTCRFFSEPASAPCFVVCRLGCWFCVCCCCSICWQLEECCACPLCKGLLNCTCFGSHFVSCGG